MDRNGILKTLRDLPFDSREYWVAAGAAMVLHGLREQTADLDLGCSAALADRLEAEGLPCRHTEDGKRCFRWGGNIEIFEEWLEDTVVSLDGVPAVSLRGLLAMKLALNREKDRRDIALLTERLRRDAEN